MKLRWLTLVSAFVLALGLGMALGWAFLSSAPAQEAAPASAPLADPLPAPGLVFEGMVHAVGTGAPSLWVVGDFPVTVFSSTVVISNGLAAQPGVWARVEAVKRAGLQATTLELQTAPTSDLYNRIEAIDLEHGEWRVGQTWVSVGPQTQVTGHPPAVGYLALVHGDRSDRGIDARRILVVSADSEVIYQGAVKLLGSSTWLVDDVVVEIAPTTVFSGAVPALGSQVQVRGTEVGPRRLRAAHVWTLENVIPQVRFAGWLQRIDGQDFPFLWRVNLIDGPLLRPTFMLVFADTLVDETAGPAVPGAWLSGEAIYQGNGSYRVQSIAVLPRSPKQQIVEPIIVLPSGGMTGIWQVGGYRVEVSPVTGIVGVPNVGAMIWVSGTPDYANVLQAQLIEVLGGE
jgi:hypothetical protein